MTKETDQDGVAKIKKMLLGVVPEDGMFSTISFIFAAVRGDDRGRRLGSAPLRAARGQLHLHERRHVLHAVARQQRRHPVRDPSEPTRLPAAVPAVQLGVHPVRVPGGRGDGAVQPQVRAAAAGASQHRAHRAGVQRGGCIFHLLHDGGQQYESTVEVERQCYSCIKLLVHRTLTVKSPWDSVA